MKKITVILFLLGSIISTFASATSCDIYGYGVINYSDGSCACDSGYILQKSVISTCIAGASYCQQKYGSGGKYDSYSGTCSCSSGYVLGNNKYYGNVTCLSCTEKYGKNSEATSLGCGCKEGYILKNDLCELSSNSAYFSLEEYDTLNDRAIIKAQYDEKRYLIDLEYTVGMTVEMSASVGNQIVVNMGTDFSVDSGDYVILVDSKTTFKITDVNEIDSNFSLLDKDKASDENQNNLPMPSRELIGYWQDYAKKVAEKGIIQYRNNPSEYNVVSPVLRQEIIAMAIKMYGVQLPDNYNCRRIFEDISALKPNNWVCRTAELAADQGIITKENKNFNPEVNVTVAESLAILFKSNGISYKNFDTKGYTFPTGTPDWQKPVLAFAQYHGLISVVTIGNLPAYRGQIFSFVLRMKEIPVSIFDLLEM